MSRILQELINPSFLDVWMNAFTFFQFLSIKLTTFFFIINIKLSFEFIKIKSFFKIFINYFLIISSCFSFEYTALKQRQSLSYKVHKPIHCFNQNTNYSLKYLDYRNKS